MEYTIECQTRPEGSKPKALRREGKLPAVLYGHQGAESLSLVVDATAVEKLLRDASVNNSLVRVTIPEMSWNGQALLREVQMHPWRGTPYHVSFFAVANHGALEVDVPLHFVGTAIGVKQNGGSLDPSMSSLHVKCLAEKIPEQIEIDVTDLDVGDALNVSQIPLPAGVVAVDDADRVVVSVLQGGGD